MHLAENLTKRKRRADNPNVLAPEVIKEFISKKERRG